MKHVTSGPMYFSEMGSISFDYYLINLSCAQFVGIYFACTWAVGLFSFL